MTNLLTILFRPRETMKAILANRDRMVVPLVLLTILSSGLKDVRLNLAQQAASRLPSPTVWLIVTVVFFVVVPLFVALFYLFSWIAMWIAKLFDGSGTTRGVRSAMAWGCAPVIWALVYRIPVALFVEGTEKSAGHFRAGQWIFNPTQLSGMGCGLALFIAMLNIVVLVWYLIVASNTLAEALNFSAWRGFATLMLTWLSPLVVLLAAVLAKVT